MSLVVAPMVHAAVYLDDLRKESGGELEPEPCQMGGYKAKKVTYIKEGKKYHHIYTNKNAKFYALCMNYLVENEEMREEKEEEKGKEKKSEDKEEEEEKKKNQPEEFHLKQVLKLFEFLPTIKEDEPFISQLNFCIYQNNVVSPSISFEFDSTLYQVQPSELVEDTPFLVVFYHLKDVKQRDDPSSFVGLLREPTQMSLKALVKEAKDNLTKMGGELSGEREIVMAGHNGMELIFVTEPEEGQKIKSMQRFLNLDGTTYVLLLQAVVDIYDEEALIASQLLDSFSLSYS